MAAKGSKPVLTAPNRDFRVTPSNGHHQVGPVGPVRAMCGRLRVGKDFFHAEELIAKRGKAGNLGNPLVARIGNDMQQVRDPFASDRRDNAELGEMRTDRIDHRGLLADKQMASAVKHQTALLLGRLCWDEPHVGAGDRLANRLCVSHVVLMPFDVGLDVSRRH